MPGMSDYAQIPTGLICRFGELSKTEIVVISFLYASRNRKTGQCNPSRASIGRAIGVDRSHVGRAVESLESKEWIFEMAEGGWTLFPDPPIVAKSATPEVAESATVAKSAHVQNPQHTVAKSATDPCEIRNTLNKDSFEQRNEQKNEQSVRAHEPDDPVVVYHEFFPEVSLGIFQQDFLRDRIHDPPRWRKTLATWKANKYISKNIANICDFYDEQGNKNGTNQNGRGAYPAKRTDADVIAESAEFYDNYPA